jgi:hypothetical protein
MCEDAALDSMMEHDRACKINHQEATSVNCNPLTLFALSFLKAKFFGNKMHDDVMYETR